MASRSAVNRAALLTFWTAVLLAVLPASPAYALPNLTPYQPSGWSDKIVVSKTTGANSDSTSLTPTDTLYVDSARLNNGNAPTTVRFYTELYVDGSLRATFYKDPPLNPDFYSYSEDYSIGSLPAGMHTIRIKVDSTNAIAETDETDNEYTKTIVVTGTQTCGPGPNDLCLNNSRFKVHVNWRVPSQGTSGVGTPVQLTGDTGYFWFFNSSNVELVIKVLDGRPVNGRFWVFYGALSNVEYTITVTDSLTGAVKTYLNPSGTLASFADTDAFAGGSGFSSPVLDTDTLTGVKTYLNPNGTLASFADKDAFAGGSGFRPLVRDPGDVVGHHTNRASDPASASTAQVSDRPFAHLAGTALAACTANSSTLCLNNGRFEVKVAWAVPSQGQAGVGTAVPLPGGDTGYFWFFNAGNVELTIKVLNGTTLNGKFWVFFGALSNVQYTIHVRDTATGEEKDYTNPDGRLASRADTDAFSAGPIVPVTLAVTSVTATTEYVPGTVPPAVAYWSTFTVQETGGRSGATISTILVHLQNRNPPVTSAEKTYTVNERVTANGSKTFRFGIVVQGTSTTVLLNEVNFIVSYTDDNGVAGFFSTRSSTSISAPTPTFADFNGSWSGTFTGQSNGTLAFTVANGAITVTQPAAGDGILTLGELAGDGSFTTRAPSGSCTWSGPFLAGGARQSSASGLWRCGAVSGPWSAARSATTAPPTSNYFFANWTCNNSSQCSVVRGHPNGSAGPFCSVTACTAWNTANGVGTCASQASYPIYNYPPAGTCWK